MNHARHLLLIALTLPAAVACGDDDPSTGPPPATTGTGGEGGGMTNPTTGGGGEGGMGTGGMGGMGGMVDPGPACDGNRAFMADGMAFAEPTPSDLANALAPLATGANAHPITVVLLADEPAQVGASFSLEENGIGSFVGGLEPAMAPATIDDALFSSNTPAPVSYIRLRHLAGVIDIPVYDADIDATTELDCAVANISLSGVIPADARDETVTLADGEHSLGDLAGGMAEDDIPLLVTFNATSIAFDFTSMEDDD